MYHTKDAIDNTPQLPITFSKHLHKDNTPDLNGYCHVQECSTGV